MFKQVIEKPMTNEEIIEKMREFYKKREQKNAELIKHDDDQCAFHAGVSSNGDYSLFASRPGGFNNSFQEKAMTQEEINRKVQEMLERREQMQALTKVNASKK